jgi:hypothetical protein
MAAANTLAYCENLKSFFKYRSFHIETVLLWVFVSLSSKLVCLLLLETFSSISHLRAKLETAQLWLGTFGSDKRPSFLVIGINSIKSLS